MEEKETASLSFMKRKARVKRLKKYLMIFLFTAYLIPVIISVLVINKLSEVNDRINVIEDKISYLEEKIQETEKTADLESDVEEDSKEKSSVSETVVATTDLLAQGQDAVSGTLQDDGLRKIYLTFDDGPSAHTEEILDILKTYNVNATFFVVGKEEPEYIPIYNRIVEEGNSLGLHSYSHIYNEIYASLDAYSYDLTKLHDFLYDITGDDVRIVRFPGGSSNTVSNVPMTTLINYLNQNDYVYFDWNVSSQDASSSELSANQIYTNVMNAISDQDEIVVLMHDLVGKETTVEALPLIIEGIQNMDNTVLLPITADTIPIQHIKSE